MRWGIITLFVALFSCLHCLGDGCKGRVVLKNKTGIISDGDENYQSYARCEWLIDAGSPNRSIYLEFEFLNTECSYDFLFLFDGDSYHDPMIASLSGNNSPAPLLARSGKMLVYLFSDRNYERFGFEARYKVQDCPYNCHGHGNCIEHVCHCFQGRTGVACERELCPNDCGQHGDCVQVKTVKSSNMQAELDNSTNIEDNVDNSTSMEANADNSTKVEANADNSTSVEANWNNSSYIGDEADKNSSIVETEAEHSISKRAVAENLSDRSDLDNEAGNFYCRCHPGYTGYTCNISLNDASGSETWYEVSPSGTGFAARSAHAGTLLSQTNCLYIFGGFTLNDILDDLIRYCLDKNNWETVEQNGTWPTGRYEHAIAQYDYGFYMFGGILDNGEYSNDLWYFNATSETWTLCAENSNIKPIGLSGHSLTVVEDDIYLFGGKSIDGRFWSNMYKISCMNPQQWESIYALGGKDRRLVGHSTVYHKESKSLLIYGGYSHSRDQPRYGSHMNNLHAFHIENRIWSQIHFDSSDKTQVPYQRSFHSAQIMGNYMIIYGGNTHIHHDHELCYDFEMYLYHLGCHTWVRIGSLMKKYYEERKTMKRQGRVSHVAAAAYGNMLLVAGGYSGYVRGDLIAFKFPTHVAPPTSQAVLDLDFCANFTSIEMCSMNPDCFYCNNITTTNREGCMHRSMENDLCREHSSFYKQTQAECPGICGLLSTCLECMSQGQGVSLSPRSPQRWTYIQPCNWCVKEGKCQQRSKPEGTCANSSNTPSRVPGWWGGLSASLSRIEQCHLEDFPAGLQAVKYRPVVDYNNPDEVQILRETQESETFRHIYSKEGSDDYTHWMGFIHPLNATIRTLVNNTVIYTLKLLAENISVAVRLSKIMAAAANSTVADISKAVVSKNTGKTIQVEFERYRNNALLFPNRTRGNRYYTEVWGSHQYPKFNHKQMQLGHQMYKVELKWNGYFPDVKAMSMYGQIFRPFSYEFLEPYSDGRNCSQHSNCLACMTDALCGWCGPDNTCVPRNSTTEGLKCRGDGKTKLLITEPSVCPVCPDYVDCRSCARDPQCEWVNDYVYCVRRGRAKEEKVVRNETECPSSCHERKTCSSCLNISECAWCENLRTCLPFSDYMSRHRHGQCTDWIDSEVANSNPYTCRNCSALLKCDQCLNFFNCGWCGNRVNPTIGVCAEGDFHGPYGDATCSEIVGELNKTSALAPADWSYANCPDVEECLLGLANCHDNATCTNTPTSFNCTCNRGFIGDGKRTCERTCYYQCAPGGLCMEDEDGEFYCDCDLGWTGDDCGTDCGCNKHSMCTNGTGKCDLCLNGTTGPFCDQCVEGYFGDPTKLHGCMPCKCNKHGDKNKGQCHNKTGECFCMDNTEGYNCEQCQRGYYGTPSAGGKCYLSCDHGLIVNNVTRGSVGSHHGPGVTTWRAYCLWIFKTLSHTWQLPSITFGIEDLAVECERDHVYVYDGIPKFIDDLQDGKLLGVFCGFYTGMFNAVVARSGVLTVYFDADISGNVSSTRGFNGSYFVNECAEYCAESNNQQCYDGACTCKDGYEGFPTCTKKCDIGCVYVKESDACACEANFGPAKYQITTWDFNEFHSTGPVSRYGHVLIHCDDEVMYMFGGRSLKHGLLNDIWRYSFTTKTWAEIKPITNDKPSPRYFHAGACVPILKHLYIFGGLVRGMPDNPDEYVASKEMWKFAIDHRKWSGRLEPDWVEGVAGHTMTLVERSRLVIIGGFSTENYFNDVVYSYEANSLIPPWETQKLETITGGRLVGIYGHSAMYNEASQTIYIYGGHVFKDETLKVSNHLFTYDITNNAWNTLHPEPNSELESRYFHSAIGFDEYMVVFGGFTEHRNTSRNILVYKYKCNYWFTLDLSGTEAGRVLTSLQAAQAVHYNGSIYVHGGTNHVDHSQIYKLLVPGDICTVLGTVGACRRQPGCSAVIERDASGENLTHCYTKGGTVLTKNAVYIAEISGQPCNLHWHSERNCTGIVNCSECVAVYPQFKGAQPSCFWCGNCRFGRCIPRGYVCDSSNNDCTVKPVMKNNASSYPSPRSECPKELCRASTCERCEKSGCVWSQLYKRTPTNRGGVSRQSSDEPEYDWSCVMKNLADQLPGYRSFMSPPMKCPKMCKQHHDCAACLGSKGGEGGSQECYWSDTLRECMAPAYLSLHCLGGECGTILQGSPDKCPAPCSVNTKCADCRRAQGCGWCAFGGENGKGACLPGTMSGPHEGAMCELHDVALKEKITDVDILERAPDWAYATCPPEDECLNGHHNCDTETQDCEDRLDGFTCRCKMGYLLTDIGGREMCTPVCHQGCINGRCVKPDRCECTFGYVGRNCSTQCECNGHSTCKSVAQKDICIDCKNNTQGAHCEECKPLFVGDPVNGGRCVSCSEFCHNHTDICLHLNTYSEYKNAIESLQRKYGTHQREFMEQFRRYSPRGSSSKADTLCMSCQDNTSSQRCEDCQQGYFRQQHEPTERPCRKCQCNGHGDDCDSDSGLRCICQNHTDTACTTDGKGDIPCHELQCAICEDRFLGKPTNGHHCYRTMHVNWDYCFDPDSQTDCLNPRALLEGRTVFFAVQPRFVNVDIRVIIDVTVGGIDVFFSPYDDTFIVNVDSVTGIHTVQLDSKYTSQRHRRSATNISTITEVHTKDINTFITVDKPDTVLIVRNVRWRLVITLPNERLYLKTSRFYMVFLSHMGVPGGKTLGNMTFRQDQPHIDLFVFFSVFFSCFFLFLAMCVLLWKTKQGFDARRTRQQRAREMLHMASRPFAKVLVYLSTVSTPFNISPELKNRGRKVNDRTPLLPSETSLPLSPVVVRENNFKIVPIAIEPTDDCVAAIGTVVFQLPGGVNAPSQLCLGSTLAKGYQLSQSAPSKFRRPLNSSNC